MNLDTPLVLVICLVLIFAFGLVCGFSAWGMPGKYRVLKVSLSIIALNILVLVVNHDVSLSVVFSLGVFISFYGLTYLSNTMIAAETEPEELEEREEIVVTQELPLEDSEAWRKFISQNKDN